MYEESSWLSKNDKLARRMKQSVALDVRQFLDEHPLSNFQILAATMCGAIAFMDGYDVQAMGFVAPALSADLQIPRAQRLARCSRVERLA